MFGRFAFPDIEEDVVCIEDSSVDKSSRHSDTCIIEFKNAHITSTVYNEEESIIEVDYTGAITIHGVDYVVDFIKLHIPYQLQSSVINSVYDEKTCVLRFDDLVIDSVYDEKTCVLRYDDLAIDSRILSTSREDVFALNMHIVEIETM